jgi:hypothetical protein
MSHVTRLPLSTHGSDSTRMSSLKVSRPRTSIFRFRSTAESSHDDDVELQHLLSPSSGITTEDADIPTETNEVLGSEHPTTAPDNLIGLISGTRGSITGYSERTSSASRTPRPSRKVVKALETLIRDIDQQDHIPPRWSHVRPWLLSATQHTPCARPDTTGTKTSFTQLEVPPAVKRYLAASRHESWYVDARKAARTVRTWVGYDVIAKSVMEVAAAKKAKDTDDVWHSWWAV